MKKFQFNAIAMTIALACGSSVVAQSLSKDQFKDRKDSIAAEQKAAKADCDSFAGNAKGICNAQAGGKEKVAMAELDAEYKPSRDATYKVRVARADADYAVARAKCDDRAGNVKDVCVKQAKAAEVAAKADATSQKKTANANEIATEKGIAARNDAVSDKRDADYAVAKEKCDAFAGNAKSSCLNEAKARFGKA